jgi:twitching motility protein PilT
LNIPETLDYRETDLLIHSIITEEQRQQLLKDRNLDFSYSLPTQNGDKAQRFRANAYFDLEHLALNMRKIDEQIRPFKTLGVHPEVAKALSLKYYKYGLTLITGITGSGKSSTLDTIIDANNRTVDSHIVIIASPVELIHKPKRSVVRHREVGRDVTSFKNGAVQALRQDPDIIVIGELRDPETIMTTLEITDSGHKTFGTLHTSSAMESIERILGEVPTEEQNRVRSRLADVLTGVISQKLVPSLDGKRVLAKEVLMVTPSVRAAIRNDNVNEIYQMLAEGSEKGMITMEQDLKRLFDEGKISKEEAINNANNKKRLYQLLNDLDY